MTVPYIFYPVGRAAPPPPTSLDHHTAKQKHPPSITMSLRGALARTPGWPLLPFGQFTFWQSASFRPRWGRAARCAAGVTDCHGALPLAMTVVGDGWSFLFARAMIVTWSAWAVPHALRGKCTSPERRGRRSLRCGWAMVHFLIILKSIFLYHLPQNWWRKWLSYGNSSFSSTNCYRKCSQMPKSAD